MPQRPVSLEPGRDGDPGRAGEDWLAWCEALEASGQPLGPDDEEEPDDDVPWDADLDALIAECRELAADEVLAADQRDHRFEAKGHDPGGKLRHLSQVRHATCTSPVCRRPAAQCDVEHNAPYEAGGRTCLCNTGPKCRHDHRLKQHPRWKVDQLPDGTFRWTTPAGRTYDTEPTRYPI